ncbi:hypothetical protein [Pseudomonas sp. BN102]|uniref:hypothetical protein n=1 Tax=Pseudomonas sp. BN102 TaxID=2567886 RepID=UPI0024543DE8|nr:hypothetical protein [Pseudomonas sp. BN102]MDH4611736.1 hypothetical protein [Pseudomonas sp. BN102]
MNAKECLALVMVAGGLSACASPAGKVDEQRLDVRMTATERNAGEIAQATLVPRGGETGVTLFVSGVPSSVARPVHLYTYIYPGTCAAPGASPAYELNRTVNTYHYSRGDVWRLSRTAPVALATLRSSSHSIVLRTSPADGNLDIFCGDIR